MTALRTTTDRRRPARVLAVLCCAGLAGLAGCGSGHDGAASGAGGQPKPVEQIAAGPLLPAPDPDRIEYNAETRTLTFYELPESGRWMIKLPGHAHAIPAGPEHKFPVGIDPDRTLVHYARPGGQQSRAVTLRAIQDRQTVYVSHNR